MANLECKKPKPCQPIEKPKEIYPPPTEPFEQCVGDYTLKWDGTRLTRKRTRTTPDGTYTSLSLVDGCVVGYDYANEPTYTPPYCNPNPTPCQQGGATSASYTISPHRDNSLVESSQGLFARTFVRGEGAISVNGTGTNTNPYIISLTGNTNDVTITGEKGIDVRESGGVTYVGLATTGVTKGIYNGFSINEYGQITGFSDSISQGDGNVKAGAGLTATDDGDITTIAHPEHDIETTAVFGAYAVVLNKSGHIIDADRLATVTAGTYALGAFNVAINEYGGIVTITQDEEVPDGAGTFTTLDNKVISYNASGRITEVSDISNAPTANAPRPIRDMYKFTVQGKQVKKEIYGNEVNVFNLTDTTFDIQLPTYVVSTLQVQVSGAVSHSLKGNVLTITHTGGVVVSGDKVITVVLRA